MPRRSDVFGFCLLTVVFAQPQSTQNYVSVSTSYGVVQGKTVDLGNDPNQLYNGQANVFLGIPYAQAPVGAQRFQAPQEPRNFNQVYDATYYRPKCPQADAGYYVNEDCLYLNVFSQQVGNQSASMAVMVLIDGGNGFNAGGQDDTQLKGTVSNLAQRGIVVVSIQYRLGALGFFTTYTDQIRPNLGMLDQVQALRWVSTQISNFGGDPNRVTVLGQGDGACAVSAHTLSPMSQNLFQQAIIQSGSIYNCFNNNPAVPAQNPQQMTFQNSQGFQQQSQQQQQSNYQNSQLNVASQQQQPQQLNYDPGMAYVPLGQQQTTSFPPLTSPDSSYNAPSVVYDDPNQQLAAQLCNVSSQQWDNGQLGNLNNCLNNFTVDVFVQQANGRTATWMIVRDNDFLPDSLENLAARRPPIPIIIGTVQDEDADYAFKMIANGNGATSSSDAFNTWLVDFARKNKLNSTATNQVADVISRNYDIGNPNNGANSYNNQAQYQPTQQYTNNYANGANYNNHYNGSPSQIAQTSQTNYATQSQYSVQTGQMNNYNQDQGQYGQANFNGQNQYPPVQNGQINNNQNQGQYNQNQYSSVQNGQINNYNQNQYQPVGSYNYLQYGGQFGNANAARNYYDPQPLATTTSAAAVASNGAGGAVTNLQSLQTITQIATDSSVSLTTTEIDDFMQNGDRHVRIYQFTHVSSVGRNSVPNTGNWQPVFKGQDMFFLTMSETVWSNSTYTAADRQVADDMGRRWSDFVKTGQVNNWSPSTPQNYAYCNLNQQPTVQTNYGQQARRVFEQQVNPIVTQAQQQQQQLQQNQVQRTPTQVQYNNNGQNSQDFHISFTIQNPLPHYG
ncbi:unnamed protein product [Caenorhabditis auriculariae]|uniref:Carboxylesterase type B domain-containing protein n=1 Tax=Caenorhabditis auriculariae TaxID=2777116 RepID=A0A8S1GZN2_9PELO|nr:unnamed protein product [Caenorhabditis auriculariae]